jgi:hypothetical protein
VASLTSTSDPASATRSAPRIRPSGAAVTGAILLAITLCAAISIDVVKTGFGIKGDEATYVAMALSVAHDRDLSYDRRDLERFWGLYRAGPDGIFLKRGKQWHVRLGGSPPYVHVTRTPDARGDRLYFAKAMIYPVAAAPFVWLFGLNGLFVFHVLLLFGVCVCGYQFLAAQARPGQEGAALACALAFVGASVVPVLAVFLTSDTFNFALVFYAYFLWLYKEVAPAGGSRFLRSQTSDVCAAILLGLATYSKPHNALLIAPLVAWWWWRRRFTFGFLVGTTFVAATVALFAANALGTGEFNYQGGDRKTFYGSFPFDSAEDVWNRQGREMSTNDSDADNVLAPSEFFNRLALNVEYFLLGRHHGFVPYFFPGALAIVLWLASSERSRLWRVFTFLTLAASVGALLVLLPYTWNGGGGPPGNRYFISLYPLTFFLLPPVTMGPAVLAWVGGALFTAKMLVNPFVAAKFTYDAPARGFARQLPVELTMANDLPVRMDDSRSHVPFHDVLLYFLDERSYLPEQPSSDPNERAVWVSGSGRSDILVRSDDELDHLTVTAQSPIRTIFTISAGAGKQVVPLEPGKPATFDVKTSSVRGLASYALLLSVRSSAAFTPHLLDPASRDFRNLGVLMTFTPVNAQPVR